MQSQLLIVLSFALSASAVAVPRAAALGSLGGAAPPVTNSGDSKRPFEVNGNTFVNQSAAQQRSCDIQNNACFNAVNAGGASFTQADCQAQQQACNAAAPSTSASSTTGSAAGASGSTAAAPSTSASSTAGAATLGNLGGAAPPVTNSGDSKRPFEVNGNTFVNQSAAQQRSCDIQNNACFNAVNAGGASFTQADCQAQQQACNTAAPSTSGSSTTGSAAGASSSTTAADSASSDDVCEDD